MVGQQKLRWSQLPGLVMDSRFKKRSSAIVQGVVADLPGTTSDRHSRTTDMADPVTKAGSCMCLRRIESRMNWQPSSSNDPRNAFQNSGSIVTHDKLLGSAVFAGETLHVRWDGQQSAAARASKDGRFAMYRCVHEFLGRLSVCLGASIALVHCSAPPMMHRHCPAMST